MPSKKELLSNKVSLKENEKLWKELDIINEMGQSTVIVSSGKKEERLFMELYRKHLFFTHKTIYVNFKNVCNMRDLAEKILDQCSQLFDVYTEDSLSFSLDCWRSEVDYKFLDQVLRMSQKIAEELQVRVVFWIDNFTEVLKLKDSTIICALMRSEFQMQQDVTFVFTSDQIDLVNAIFMDYDKPFFRFARIVKMSTN